MWRQQWDIKIKSPIEYLTIPKHNLVERSGIRILLKQLQWVILSTLEDSNKVKNEEYLKYMQNSFKE